MSEIFLMLIASQLISNPNPNVQAQYAALSNEDQAKVEAYISNQDELPSELEMMIQESNQQNVKGGMKTMGPSYETSMPF